MFAQLQLLCLTEEEKAGHFFEASPYISGELYRYVVEAAQHVEGVAQFALEQGAAVTAEEFVSFANARSAIMLYFANGLNMVRIQTGDADSTKDWYKPFVEAMLVFEEHVLRRKLGLPDLLAEPLDGLKYSLFMNYVLDGEANPFLSWRRAHPDLYLAGEGPRRELSPSPK